MDIDLFLRHGGALFAESMRWLSASCYSMPAATIAANR